MLHLSAGFVRFSVAALFACFPKTELPDDSTQCGITDINAVVFAEHLVCPLNPAVALVINTADQFRVDVNFILSGGLRHLTDLANYGTGRIGADVHVPRNFSDPHALFV